MEYISTKTGVERAGRYLMDLLKTEPLIRYSRFYDGTVETAKALNRTLGLDENDWPPEEGLMNWAIDELEEVGLVKTEDLPNILADGYSDYEVSLTDAGRDFLGQGGLFTLPDEGGQTACDPSAADVNRGGRA